MAKKSELMSRLERARVAMILGQNGQPFWGQLATRLKNVEVENHPAIPTAGVDGVTIFWNKAFAASLSDAELMGVLAHEVCHAAQGHIWRKGGREHEAWNIAADLSINPVLVEAQFTLPDGVIFPPRGQEGKAAEEYYQNPPPLRANGGGSGKGKGSGGGFGIVLPPPPGTTATQAQEMQQEWKIAVAQAFAAAKAAGDVPAGIERMVNDLLHPRVPWHVVLKDFVQRTARNDYNMIRPNRRHVSRGIYLPTLISDELPEIVIGWDTSGSIGQKVMDVFGGEVSGVLGAYETTIHLAYADAAVAHVQTLTRADLPLRLEPKGGGGTDFRPVFDWVEEKGITPACLIYLTDLEGDFPQHPPDYPVLWVATTDHTPPWGQCVAMGPVED